MAERFYQIPDKPVYNTKIREIQNSDPVNASMIVNPVLRQLLENIAAVKQLADSALKLAQPRKIGNASFDGSADITLAQMGAAASSHTHPAQTEITGNAATANKWKTARKINGLSIDGSADRCSYAVCSTAAGTAAKVVDCSGFILVTGAEITVKFTVTNTAANPTLNVAGTGAKPVYYRGGAVAAGYLAANRTYTFRYNGTQYELVGDINTDTNTTYNPATQSANGLMSADDKKKLDGIAAEANKYSHPTSAGNKHIPAGGSAGKILKWSADGTAVWGDAPAAVTGSFSVSGPSGWTANHPAAGLYQYTLGSSAIPGLTAKHRIDLQASYETLLSLEAPIQAVNDSGTCKLVSSEPLDHSVTLQYTLVPTI